MDGDFNAMVRRWERQREMLGEPCDDDDGEPDWDGPEEPDYNYDDSMIPECTGSI